MRIRDAISTDIDNKTNTMILAQYGQDSASGEGYKLVSLKSASSKSTSYGIKNDSEKTLEVTVDLSESDNVIFSSKDGIIKKVVKPGALEFAIHTQGGTGNFNVDVKHSSVEIAGKK